MIQRASAVDVHEVLTSPETTSSSDLRNFIADVAFQQENNLVSHLAEAIAVEWREIFGEALRNAFGVSAGEVDPFGLPERELIRCVQAGALLAALDIGIEVSQPTL